MTATDDFKITLAKHVAGTTSYTAVTLYLGLAGGSNAATNLAAGNARSNELSELPGGAADYARATVAWAEDGITGIPENSSDITFTAGGTWPAATHWFLASSATEGADDVIIYGSLTATRTLSSGDVIRYATGALALAS